MPLVRVVAVVADVERGAVVDEAALGDETRVVDEAGRGTDEPCTTVVEECEACRLLQAPRVRVTPIAATSLAMLALLTYASIELHSYAH